MIRDRSTNNMIFLENLSTGNIQYTVTNDNRLIVKASKPFGLESNKTYYIYVSGDLIKHQSSCSVLKTDPEETGFSFGWDFQASEKSKIYFIFSFFS